MNALHLWHIKEAMTIEKGKHCASVIISLWIWVDAGQMMLNMGIMQIRSGKTWPDLLVTYLLNLSLVGTCQPNPKQTHIINGIVLG